MSDAIRWFAIAADNTYNEFIEPNKLIPCAFWIRRTDTGKRHTTMYRNTFEIYNYDFFDTELKPIKYSVGGWKLFSCNNFEYKNTIHNLKVEIADPLGQIKEFRETEREIDGILVNIEKIKKLSKFKDWRDFETFDQVRILEEKNAALQSEVDSLKSVMREFASCSFFLEVKKEISGIDDSAKVSEILKAKGLPKGFQFDWITYRKF